MPLHRHVVREVRLVAALSSLEVRRPARLAGAAALRGDLDDAVRRRGAVQRDAGRSANDVDRLDVLGVDVVDARRRLAARGDVGAERVRRGDVDLIAIADVVVRPDAVDDQQRLVRQRQRVRATHADARPGAGRAIGLLHIESRSARVQHVREVARRRELTDGRRDRGNAAARLALTDLLTGGRDGHLIERDDGRA